MRKKEAENVQETGSNSKKNLSLRSGSNNLEGRSKPGSSPKITEDPRYAQAVQNYQAGLSALQGHKYDKAKAFLEKVVAGPSPELADRATVHLNSCIQQLNRNTGNFKTPEERYDYAVSLMNMGDYVSAREVFQELTAKCPKLDYVWYGAAALNCLMGHFPDAIAGLNEAIRLKPSNRYQARNDSDFKSLADDPRFTELLYPDTSDEAASDSAEWHF